MIRKFLENDLEAVMGIWLETNIRAHSFIPPQYWKDRYAAVKEMLPEAEVYVYEDNAGGRIEGFIGLTGNYIAGVFVKEEAQSKGIGKLLIDHVKGLRSGLTLHVYQKNTRAVRFYLREGFAVQSDGVGDNTNEREYMMIWNGNLPRCIE